MVNRPEIAPASEPIPRSDSKPAGPVPGRSAGRHLAARPSTFMTLPAGRKPAIHYGPVDLGAEDVRADSTPSALPAKSSSFRGVFG